MSVVLTERGILEYNNVGNKIETDKLYDTSTVFGRFFTDIENAKVALKDTYINNLPFFLKITNSYKPFKNSLNSPLIDRFQTLGNETAACPHVYSEEIIDATCDEGGYTVKTCRLCDESVKENATEPLGHNFEEASKVMPSCESDGYTLMTCSVCKSIEQRDIVKAKGHNYEEISRVPADCSLEGSITYRCSVCEFIYNEIISPLGHKWVDTVVAPSDTQAGYTLHECELCGQTHRDSFTSVGGHTHSFTETKIEPSCEKDGRTQLVCSICSYTEEKDFAEPLGHSYTVSTVKATCTEGGYDLYTCSRCNNSYRDNSKPPLGHKYSATVVAPACDTQGYTKQTCSVCSDVKKTDLVPASGHSYSVQTVAPTASSEGYDLYTCSVCKSSYKDNVQPKIEGGVKEPETVKDPSGTTYSASLLNTDKIFRHYSITAEFPDGSEKTTFARIVKLDRETLYENMLETAKLVNAMVNKDKKVNWYFSFATNLEATDIGTKILPQETTVNIYEDFLKQLDSSVQTSAVVVNSFNDYFNKFYITDHHWNHHGCEEAYMGIVKMLQKNYPDIQPLAVKKVYNFNGVKFFGSLARANAMYEVWDNFGVYFRELPEHTVAIDTAISYGSRNTQDKNIKTYVLKEHNTAQGYNHYTEFYRVCRQVDYPQNNTGRKLLLIGDSYSLPLLEIVSAHFDTTYIRYEDRGWSNLPSELVYEDFIEEKGITDVLVIEEMSKCIMQGYGDGYPSGFLNIVPDENW